MDLSTIFFRTIMIYFVVFLVLRIMGKREIGKLSVFDLVISIMIAEIAVFVLEDLNKPILEGLLPMVILVLIQIIMAFITLKSRKLRILFDGSPSILVENGVIDRQEMKKQKYSIDDLLLQLRENQISSVSDVEVAVLETNGKLSVIPKEDMTKDKTNDVQEHAIGTSTIRFAGLPLLLIMDGKVMDENLAKIKKDRFWLKNKIQEQGATDFKHVFFCSIDHKGNIFVNKS